MPSIMKQLSGRIFSEMWQEPDNTVERSKIMIFTDRFQFHIDYIIQCKCNFIHKSPNYLNCSDSLGDEIKHTRYSKTH